MSDPTHHPARWLVLALASVVTACGPSTLASPSLSGSASATPSRSAAPSPSGTGPLLTGTITVTGAYAETDTFTTRARVETGGAAAAPPAGFTCADYARGLLDPRGNGATTFVTPVVDTAGSTAGAFPVHFAAAIDAGYAGPGTYRSSTLHSLTGSMVVNVGQFIDFFRSDPGPGLTTLAVDPNGGGTLLFTNWFSSGSQSVMSGTVAWTCL